MHSLTELMWFLSGAGFVGAMALIGFATWIELVV